MEFYIYIFVALLLVVAIFLVVYVFSKRSGGRKLAEKEQQYVSAHWYRILDSFNHSPSAAVLDADKLLDYCLAKRGGKKFHGLPLGEKLKKGQAYFSDVDGVWFAHKMRNQIAHELHVKISLDDAKRALSAYKRALMDLGVKLG